MMLPASTFSPPNFFTPRRLDSESRPLRDEPPAFLCAIGVLLGAQSYSFSAAAAAFFGAAFLAGLVSPASAAASATSSFLAEAFLAGLAPPVRISEIRTMVKCWRWPRVRREFWRRRFLK